MPAGFPSNAYTSIYLCLFLISNEEVNVTTAAKQMDIVFCTVKSNSSTI